MISKTENTYKLADIWLRVSLQAHNFIPPDHWLSNADAMREEFLPISENYAFTADGEIRGFISLREDHIEALFVDIPCQGQGIGHALVVFAKSLHGRLSVCVYEENAGAIRFYRANGFRHRERRTDVSTGRPELAMEWCRE